MGIEATVDKLNGKELSEFAKVATNTVTNSNTDKILSSNTNTNQKSKRSRRRQKKMLPVQKLYETCKEVFASCGPNIVPSPANIERLRAVLDNITPEDVGLSPEMPYFRKTAARRTPAITYLHIHACDQFSIGIFCLPPSGVIPLHNHPGMTVFSKLLFGTMHIKSYDWVVDAAGSATATEKLPDMTNPEAKLAKVKVDSDFTAPCNTSILYPADGGNMHCFTGITACAVLDVLGPPYSDPDGRHCTYYLDYPLSKFSVNGVSVPEEEKESFVWLKEREKPDDLAVVGAMYRGPMIVEK